MTVVIDEFKELFGDVKVTYVEENGQSAGKKMLHGEIYFTENTKQCLENRQKQKKKDYKGKR